jgi:hypothetical protein
MTDDYKTIVERLQPDGANWVSYRDRIIWALGGKGWHEHLTSDSPTALYAAVGDVGNVTPLMRWQADDKAAMHMIASSIPNSVFSNIKSSTTAKAAWVGNGTGSPVGISFKTRTRSRAGQPTRIPRVFTDGLYGSPRVGVNLRVRFYCSTLHLALKTSPNLINSL